jgi:hypothetical protein
MTTASANDSIVHHAVILDLIGPNYRTEAAKARLPQDTSGDPSA